VIPGAARLCRRCALLAALGLATMVVPSPAHALCSVFDEHPCTPTFCSVFRRHPCLPEIDYPIGQGLRLNVQSRSDDGPAAAAPPDILNTIQDVFAALRACWVPPPMNEAKPGMEISVRFSFNRNGEIIGEPRFTYSTPTVSGEVKAAYQRAVAAALNRCRPLRFSSKLGGALAGQPFSIRFIDDRGVRRTESTHDR
jgi:hypothetical protein